jgi:D-alanyl-D-alanine carboxypeptidase/D-alanyl-D-alanine-endopeptidase (penicillin-binding protein 4)
VARYAPQLSRAQLTTVVVVLVLALGFVGAGLYAPGYAVGLTGGADTAWHKGRPAAPAPAVLASTGEVTAPTADGVAAAVRPKIGDPALGGHVAGLVVDAATGQTLFAQDADKTTVPASTLKVLTAVAVLKARGPAYRLETRAVAGPGPGEVVLVGAGDPTLGAGDRRTFPDGARLDDLANQVKQALGGTAPTKVLVDSGLFPAPYSGPGWDADVTAPSPNAAPIMSLMIDGGRTQPVNPHGPYPRVADPDLVAGEAFAGALGLPASAVARGSAPAGDAKPLGVVRSPSIERLVELMLVESDNVIAESLARQVALARGQPPSFAGAADATKAQLADLGLNAGSVTLKDGSGLSRDNRVSAGLLAAALTLASKPDQPDLRGIFPGLPVAGYSGTLQTRYRTARSGNTAAGLVRAKTGSLNGISSMAGIVVDADGRTLAFAFIADQVTSGDATPTRPSPSQEALDRITSTLAACGCH